MADINSKNKVRSARTERLIGKDNVNKVGDSGIYGANPSPALRDYPQSTGKDTIPLKFGETMPSSVNTRENLIRGMKGQGTQKKAQVPGSSTIMKSQNRYRGPMEGKRGFQTTRKPSK